MKTITIGRLTLLFFFFSILLLRNEWARGQCAVTQTFNASSTWTCPPNVTTITVEAWGGGGAGGSATGSSSFRAMGGAAAGGAYAKSTTISVVPGVTYTVTVGAGGVSSSVNNSVTNGGASWFNTPATINAQGGAGGQSVVVAGAIVIGTGGIGSSAASIGSTVFAGGSGATSTTTATGTSSPGGGGSAGTASNGNNGGISAGGAAVAGGGAGANGPSTAGSNGLIGSAPGGGGSGAWAAASTTVRTGGTGGAGRVIISYTPVVISGTTNVCVNENTTLTPSITGGAWDSGTPANASIDASSGVVLGLAAGTSLMTYTVTVTGCVSSNTSTVTVNPLPALTVVNPAAVCSPTTVDITSATVQTVNTGTTTKYYDSYTLALAGGASNVATPAAIAASGTYYIRTELATGCYVVQPVTVTINQSPNFAPVTVQPTCTANGSITFAELTPGTYTYTYNIDGGASNTISPSAGNLTISVPMGVQPASVYNITATRTDQTPNCSKTVAVNIAAIPYCVTPTAQVADPCSCNNDQTADGSQTGTFNETIVVNGSGAGQIWTVKAIAPLVMGTAPTLALNTVLSPISNSGANGIDDDGDGSTDEPDEAYMYSTTFVHTDDAGYTAKIEGPGALGAGGNQTLDIQNLCQYPEIVFGTDPATTYCVNGAALSIPLAITEANSMAGTATFSGAGVSGTTFAPAGGGTYVITATFASTAGTGKGGAVGAPATPANVCYTSENKTTTVTDSRCTTFPW